MATQVRGDGAGRLHFPRPCAARAARRGARGWQIPNGVLAACTEMGECCSSSALCAGSYALGIGCGTPSRALCVSSNVQSVQGCPGKGACRHVLAVEIPPHGPCPLSAAALCRVDLEQRRRLRLGNAVRSGFCCSCRGLQLRSPSQEDGLSLEAGCHVPSIRRPPSPSPRALGNRPDSKRLRRGRQILLFPLTGKRNGSCLTCPHSTGDWDL
ncbi:hypothetical protein EDB80DRAFT_296592 [Ilyonectria destructans]|nr:hypothetical protein EDB80DRAFT_296592 [Ilyonectria destructans]